MYGKKNIVNKEDIKENAQKKKEIQRKKILVFFLKGKTN